MAPKRSYPFKRRFEAFRQRMIADKIRDLPSGLAAFGSPHHSRMAIELVCSR